MNSGLKTKLSHAFRLDRAVRFVWRAGPRRTVSSLVLVCLQGLVPLLILYLVKLIVDSVASYLKGSKTGDVFAEVGLLIAAVAVVTLVHTALQALGRYVQEAQSLEVTDHMYGLLHAKSVSADLEFYENPDYFDTLHRAQREGPYRPTRILSGLIQIGISGVSLLAMAGLLLSFHWGTAIIIFVAVVPGVLVRLRYSDKLFQWQQETTASEREAAYIHWLLTGDQAAKEMRLFQLGSHLQNRFRDLHTSLREGRLTLLYRRSKAELLAQGVGLLPVFGAYAWIVYAGLYGTITLGDMVMYFQATQRGITALRTLLENTAGLYEDNLFLVHLYDFLSLEPAVTPPARPTPVPSKIVRGIVFEKVGFSYPGTNRNTLEGISLTIRPGEVAALVGHNGSGKTTVAKLLCRFYDPSEGSISLDGIDLRNFDPASLRQQMGYIFQDFFKYQFSARENIWFGDIRRSREDDRIPLAAENAGAAGFIARLSNGYDTLLGRFFNNGQELSIGEWQKIALARALFRNAPFLVLDEPTSAIDADTEHRILSGFKTMLQNRTALVISHRFSAVKMADRIYVMEAGRIIERGTHQSLLEQKGTYARLFEKQAGAYKI